MNNHQLYFPPFDIDESAVDVGQKWEENSTGSWFSENSTGSWIFKG